MTLGDFYSQLHFKVKKQQHSILKTVKKLQQNGAQEQMKATIIIIQNLVHFILLEI